MNPEEPKQIQIKASDEALRGVYANSMQVLHTREEFVLDFMNLLPPAGTLNARIIVAPAHLKRILSALEDNLDQYEKQFGTIKVSESGEKSPIGFEVRS